MNPIIKEIDKGIAFRLGNTIYLHKNLKNYPNLRKSLLKHELKHTDNYKFSDFKLDAFGTDLKNVKKEYYIFLLTQRGAWKQLLPFMYVEDKLHLDITLTLLYLGSILLAIFLWGII